MDMLYSYPARQVLPLSLPRHGNERRSKWWWHYVNLLIFVILPEKRGTGKKVDTFTSHGRFCCSSTHHTTTPPTRHNNYNCTNIENKLARKNIYPFFFQPSMICREIMRIVSPRPCVTLENWLFPRRPLCPSQRQPEINVPPQHVLLLISGYFPIVWFDRAP